MSSEYFEDWVCVFPGKMGISWKYASQEVYTKEAADNQAEKNCNVVVVPRQLFETYKDVERRMVEAERKLRSITSIIENREP